jgi:hypothetical protein
MSNMIPGGGASAPLDCKPRKKVPAGPTRGGALVPGWWFNDLGLDLHRAAPRNAA